MLSENPPKTREISERTIMNDMPVKVRPVASIDPTLFVLTLDCDDKPGIVAAITTELAAMGGNIAESNQFRDKLTNRFFMRIAFTAPLGMSRNAIEHALKPAGERFGMKLTVADANRKPKIVLMARSSPWCLITRIVARLRKALKFHIIIGLLVKRTRLSKRRGCLISCGKPKLIWLYSPAICKCFQISYRIVCSAKSSISIIRFCHPSRGLSRIIRHSNAA
jgi:predicted amino acid-binding ACT domain protein